MWSSLSIAVAGSIIDAEVITSGDRKPGVKAKLASILEDLERPISAGELWDLCKVQAILT